MGYGEVIVMLLLSVALFCISSTVYVIIEIVDKIKSMRRESKKEERKEN